MTLHNLSLEEIRALVTSSEVHPHSCGCDYVVYDLSDDEELASPCEGEPFDSPDCVNWQHNTDEDSYVLNNAALAGLKRL